MSSETPNPTESENLQVDAEQEISKLASSEDVGIVKEFLEFLRDNKKWWLSPILIVLGILMLFVVLSLSPAAPFIYTLF